MPWRLIVFIIIFAIALTFIAFNLGNRCDINFGFTKFEDVPVFLTAFISLFLGMFCILPFTIGARRKRKDKIVDKIVKDDEPKPKRQWGKKKEIADPPVSDGGPYGID